mgnify:CR=1 FL=1
MKHSLLLVAVVALVAFAAPAHSQYMFLDTNADGVCNTSDLLGPASTSVDVWLDTDSNQDATPAVCSSSSNLFTINSYEVILRATGTLTYGAWTDNMAFATVLGNAQAGTDFYAGRGSGTVLAPGTYKLGSVAISGVASGATLSIVSSTSASPTALTSFGSQCEGLDFDNTLKLPTDWNNVCGTASPTPTTATTWGHIKNIYR